MTHLIMRDPEFLQLWQFTREAGADLCSSYSFQIRGKIFTRRTSCQGSWRGRIPSAHCTLLTTSLCCPPGQRTAGCERADTPVRSAPGPSGPGRRTRHKTERRDRGRQEVTPGKHVSSTHLISFIPHQLTTVVLDIYLYISISLYRE